MHRSQDREMDSLRGGDREVGGSETLAHQPPDC